MKNFSKEISKKSKKYSEKISERIHTTTYCGMKIKLAKISENFR